MTDPLRVNLSNIQAKQAQTEAKQALARQVASKSRFTEDVEDEGFNPLAASRRERRHDSSRSLSSRKKKAADEPLLVQGVEARAEEDLAHSFERRNPELPADRLNTLLAVLHEELSAEEILEAVMAAFEDATLVDEALDFLNRSTEGVLQENVTKARELLHELKGREVIAGRNIDSAAKAFYKKGVGASPTALRELYREITGDPKPHNALFAQLSGEYGFDELQDLVAFLLKGMAYDLKSKGPSISSAELQLLMTEVRNLQSILWVYLFFKARMKLIKKLYKQYDLQFNDKQLTFQQLAKEFVKIVEDRYPSVLKIMRQAERMGLDEDEEKVVVLSQYRDAIRQLSPRLYKSTRHKQDLLLAIIEALEELEEEEEED